jgi:tetratricopeptide (TPR) repeat protein
MPLEQALLFALQIARAMQHATASLPGFVHRDLKPENVLVGIDRLPGTELNQPGANRLRVTDFGLAHLLQEAQVQGGGEQGEGDGEEIPEQSGEGSNRAPSSPLSHTQLTRGMVGTPLYMAPEQWLRQPVSTATDVYALGCLLFEMLAGQRLASGNSMAELERQHCTGPRPPLPDGLPTEVQALLADCLALRPEHRPGDWDELEARLAAAYRQATGWEAPQAVAAAGELSRDEQVTLGWAYSNMGNSYLDIGKAQTATGYFERAQAIGQAQGEHRLEAAGLNHLGSAYTRLGDARRAIGYYEQALAIDRQIGDRQAEGAALGNLGVAYTDLGDARWAIGFLEQLLEIAREIGDRRGEGAALGNLGLAYYSLGDARRAIGFYEKLLEIARDIGDRPSEGAALGNLGGAYITLGDARRAIGFLEQQLVITRQIGDRRGEGAARGNLGNAHLALGDARRAIGFFEQALAIRRAIGDLSGVAADSFNMARLYSQQGEPARALPLAQEAARAFAQIGHLEYTRRAEALVAKLQGGEAPASASTAANPAQAAFDAFQRATSPAEMQAAVTRYPFMTEQGFLQAIEQVLKEQVQPEDRPAFQQRLAWLRQLANS